ncbi:uncharacterized protein LOC121112507 [Gallus gallus]|uniref:uncharacterized protein LOC121112507 n=1 Tax=Gallus gallus TaxID=9031 RepID=UPI001AE155AF|nr:uncharacterized protein LOC121112507 [Gallus gallus]
MPAAAPWRAAASSNARKLPALQAAASCTPSARGSARAMGTRGSRLPVLAPRPQQPPEMPCSCDTCSANSVSVPRLLVPQAADDGASAANTAQGKLGVRSATSRAEGQVPASGGSGTRDVGVQTELQVLEETAERESTGWSSGQLWSASLASSDEADTLCSASLLAADAGPGGHLEPLPGTGPEDGESSTSSKAEYFPEETNAAPRFWRPWEGEETATTTPEFSKQSLGEAQRLQDPGEAYGEVYGYPPVHPAIRRIRDEARKDQMRSSWNTSWPNSMSVPQLLRPQAAEDGANAADSALGTLRACSVTSRAEGQFSASDDSPARDVTAQDSQLELKETAGIEMAGQSSGTLQAASLSPSDEAHAVCSLSLLDAGPGPAGHLEPLPASVLEDAESSDSPEAASSAEEADGASLPLSVSEGGAREEPAVAMPESSGQGLGEARRLQDPREINREAYGYSPMIPALRRIREEDRNERMLSHWDISWPRNVRSPRQQRLQARGDAFSTAGTAQGMPGIRPTTSRAAVRFPDSGDSRVWSPRLSVVQEESSDDSDSAVSTAEGMQDARDTAVTDKGTHPPSCLCPSTLEAVEDDWECDSEEDAASEAVSVTPSTSDDSSAEVESTSSASSVAADPRPEEHVSACEGADVGPQHEVSAETGEGAQSSVCFRDAPEEGPGTAAAPHAAARRRMPAVFRMALRALRRVFTCSCIRGQREERHEAANTRQLPETED